MVMQMDSPLPALPAPPLVPKGPVLVFGGPYSNLEATRAVRSAAKRFGIPPERVVCTGDVVAYCADPAETLDLVRKSGIHVIMGNCEESLAAGSADCGCGFAPGSACDRLSAAWFAHADRQLDREARVWMSGLPRQLVLEIAGRRLCVVHGGVTSINRFLFASSAAAEKAGELETANCDGIIAGHCGLPFTQLIGGRLWHNPGAVGLPANDGSPRTWFSVLVPTGHGIRVEHHPLHYDFAAAAARMRRVGLPEGYAEALIAGLWPSCDVLPSKELSERGTPLLAGQVEWSGRRTTLERPASVQVRYLWPTSPEVVQNLQSERAPCT
jgi:predicted phosphodiesterase